MILRLNGEPGWPGHMDDCCFDGHMLCDVACMRLWRQVVCEPENYPGVSKTASRLRNEYVVRVEGEVRLRTAPNKKMPTGMVEVLATKVGGKRRVRVHS